MTDLLPLHSTLKEFRDTLTDPKEIAAINDAICIIGDRIPEYKGMMPQEKYEIHRIAKAKLGKNGNE